MSFALFIYLASITNGISALFIVVACISVVRPIATYIDRGVVDVKVSKLSTFIAVFVLAALLTPSETTLYKMAAAHYVQKVVESPNTVEISDKLYRLLNDKLDEQLKKPRR